MDAIANAGGGTTIDSSSQLHVASLKAGNATPSEAGASAFVDLEAQNLSVNRVRAPPNTALVLEAANFGEAVGIAANTGVVTIATQANCLHSLTVKGGRGGSLTGGAMLRIVSDGGSLLNTPPILYWGIGGVELSAFEHNWQGVSHFVRSSGSAAWSETARVASNKWHFWSGIYTPSDARLKADVRPMPDQDCLDLLRAVEAKTYVRKDLPDDGRRAGFIAQDFEAASAALGSNLMNSITQNDTELKTLSYERIGSPILWTVCRNLLARIEILEARLTNPA